MVGWAGACGLSQGACKKYKFSKLLLPLTPFALDVCRGLCVEDAGWEGREDPVRLESREAVVTVDTPVVLMLEPDLEMEAKVVKPCWEEVDSICETRDSMESSTDKCSVGVIGGLKPMEFSIMFTS